MQDQIEEKTVALLWKGTKLTAIELAKALKKLIAAIEKGAKQAQAPKTYKGKQTVKQLVEQGAGVSNIEITDANIKSFEPFARKYGIDFALKKDATANPPNWLVFFKSRDADAMTAAFKEFTASTIQKGPKKPSLLAALSKMKEQVKNNTVDQVKNKKQELGR